MSNTPNTSFFFSYSSNGYQGTDYSCPARTITFDVDQADGLTHSEVCACFQDFLKACGYMLDNGTIEFVPFSDEPDIREEDYSYQENEPELQEDANQTKFDFANNENVDTTGYEPTKATNE